MTPAHAPEQFTLDRDGFAEFWSERLTEPPGLDYDLGLAGAVVGYFNHAIDAAVIQEPSGVEVTAYGVGELEVLVAIREFDLPLHVGVRQVATFAIRARGIVTWGDETFEHGCAVIEALLLRADNLLPSFRAMQDGERRLAASH
jgi:hypothetical protein